MKKERELMLLLDLDRWVAQQATDFLTAVALNRDGRRQEAEAIIERVHKKWHRFNITNKVSCSEILEAACLAAADFLNATEPASTWLGRVPEALAISQAVTIKNYYFSFN